MKGLIYLNLHAEAYYSRAEYDETIFITPEDYRKYFCNGDKTVDAFKHASENWHCKEISVGELDGKHSDVHGDVYVDFFEEEHIRNQYSKPSNDGEFLIDEMLYSVGVTDYTKRKEAKQSIIENADKLAKEIGVFVEVKYRVPVEKVEELNEFVDNLIHREERRNEFIEDVNEFLATLDDTGSKPKRLNAERYEVLRLKFEEFRKNKHSNNEV